MKIKKFRKLVELHDYSWKFNNREFLLRYFEEPNLLMVYLLNYLGSGETMHNKQLFVVTEATLSEIEFLGLKLEKINIAEQDEKVSFNVNRKFYLFEESGYLKKFLKDNYPHWEHDSFGDQSVTLRFLEQEMYYLDSDVASDYGRGYNNFEDVKNDKCEIIIWLTYSKISNTIILSNTSGYNREDKIFKTIKYHKELLDIMQFIEDNLNKEDSNEG